MATGGTIAGKGAGAAASGVYQAGEVGIAALVEAVPDLLNISNIYGYQIVNVAESSATTTPGLCHEDSALMSRLGPHRTFLTPPGHTFPFDPPTCPGCTLDPHPTHD